MKRSWCEFAVCGVMLVAAACSRAQMPNLPPGPLGPVASPPSTAPAVVATVNGRDISSAELEQQVDRMARELSQQIPSEQLAQYLPQIRQEAVATLVNKSLLSQEVARQQVTVTDEAVKTEMATAIGDAPPGHNVDDDLKALGMTRQSFEKELRNSLEVRKLIDNQTPATQASDDQAMTYYGKNPREFEAGETASVRHILIAFADGDDAAKKADKRKKAEEVRQRLIKGEDFAKVCAETSDDPGSKANGGLYENFPRGQMVPEFDNASFTQKIGEIGPIVETQYGYHIIKVEKHGAPTTIPFDQVKEQLKDFLGKDRHEKAVQEFLKNLHETAKVTYAGGI